MAIYTIQSGDTLFKIAGNLTGLTGSVLNSYVNALVSINNIKNKNKIFPGQKINYPNEWVETVGPIKQSRQILEQSSPRRRSTDYRQASGAGFSLPGLLKNPMVLGAIGLAVFIWFQKK